MTLHFKTWHEQHDYYMNFQPLDKDQRQTVRQRSKVVADTRTAVSGGAAGTQLVDELKAMGRLEREALLKEALGKEFKITIPRGDILAMKADLGETWYKVRKLRR